MVNKTIEDMTDAELHEAYIDASHGEISELAYLEGLDREIGAREGNPSPEWDPSDPCSVCGRARHIDIPTTWSNGKRFADASVEELRIQYSNQRIIALNYEYLPRIEMEMKRRGFDVRGLTLEDA